MGHEIDTSKPLSQTRLMSGRRVIKTSVSSITDENVSEVLQKALAIHELNRSEIDYLWKYYRGEQPIQHRKKDVRPEICNKIVENRANEIVSFKVGYLCGEPIQYVSRNGGEEIVKAINKLNEFMFALCHGELFRTVGSLVGVDFAGHASRTHQSIINSTELLQIQMGIELVFHLIGEVEIIINLMSHYSVPPYNCLYSAGLFSANARRSAGDIPRSFSSVMVLESPSPVGFGVSLRASARTFFSIASRCFF